MLEKSSPFRLFAFSPFPPGRKPPHILVVAGEASGDDHAARLVAAIREFCPVAEFLGVGGEAMRAQGVRILTPASELAVVGLMEVVGHLPAIWQALRSIGRVLKTARPDLVILVDFPDFNFWVARLARYYRVPVLYYISPQVWAWRTYRVRTLARLTDRLVVIFPFEADFYRTQGVTVDYVGHPFRETLPPLTDRGTFLQGHNLDPEALTIALLPGSRAGEIERHLPTMLEAASLIHRSIPQAQFILPLASTAPEGLVQSICFGGVGAGLKPVRPCGSALSPARPTRPWAWPTLRWWPRARPRWRRRWRGCPRSSSTGCRPSPLRWPAGSCGSRMWAWPICWPGSGCFPNSFRTISPRSVWRTRS